MGFPSKVRHGVDAEPSVVLRALAGGNITASAAETAKALPILNTAFWHNNDVAFENEAIVIHVTALDKTTGDETYEIQVQVDTDQPFAGSNFVIVGRLAVTTTGVFVINLDGPTIKTLLLGGAFIRVAAVLAGTTPILNYEAWVAPSIKA